MLERVPLFFGIAAYEGRQLWTLIDVWIIIVHDDEMRVSEPVIIVSSTRETERFVGC